MRKIVWIMGLCIIAYGRENPFLFVDEVATPSSQQSVRSLSKEEKRVQEPTKSTIERPKPTQNAQKEIKLAPDIKIDEPVVAKNSEDVTKNIPKKEERPASKVQSVASHPKSTMHTTKRGAKIIKEIRLPFIAVLFYEDGFAIRTKDRVRKHFALDTPAKIVIDIAGKKDFATKRYIINAGKATRLEIGAHPTYYRVAVSVRGCSRYSTKKESSDTLRFICR